MLIVRQANNPLIPRPRVLGCDARIWLDNHRRDRTIRVNLDSQLKRSRESRDFHLSTPQSGLLDFFAIRIYVLRCGIIIGIKKRLEILFISFDERCSRTP